MTQEPGIVTLGPSSDYRSDLERRMTAVSIEWHMLSLNVYKLRHNDYRQLLMCPPVTAGNYDRVEDSNYDSNEKKNRIKYVPKTHSIGVTVIAIIPLASIQKLHREVV